MREIVSNKDGTLFVFKDMINKKFYIGSALTICQVLDKISEEFYNAFKLEFGKIRRDDYYKNSI